MNVIIWGVLWSIAGWLTGVLVYFVAGLLTLPASPETRNRAANYYSKQAMKLLGRGALLERGTKWDVYSTTHDAERNVDEVKLDGNTGHISNEAGLLSTLHKRPLGFVPPPEENVPVYVSPEVAELGRVDLELEEQGDLKTEDGEWRSHVTLGDRRPLVQFREYARRMVAGCRGMWDVDETEEIYKQSQSGFTSPKTQQYMILIVAYGAASLLAWLIITNAGGAAPTDIRVPGM